MGTRNSGTWLSGTHEEEGMYANKGKWINKGKEIIKGKERQKDKTIIKGTEGSTF